MTGVAVTFTIYFASYAPPMEIPSDTKVWINRSSPIDFLYLPPLLFFFSLFFFSLFFPLFSFLLSSHAKARISLHHLIHLHSMQPYLMIVQPVKNKKQNDNNIPPSNQHSPNHPLCLLICSYDFWQSVDMCQVIVIIQRKRYAMMIRADWSSLLS